MVSKSVAAERSAGIGPYRLPAHRGIEKKLKQVKAAQNIILVGLCFAAIFWVFEAIVDVVLFDRGTLFSQLFTPDLYQIWMRVLVICTLIMFGVYTRAVLFERKNAIEQLEEIAVHDTLTGLPNRVLFYDRLEVAMAQAKRNGTHVVAMVLDLDRFKYINDTLGHSIGDMVLRSVGERLSGVLRKSDTVARMGGDEFMIVLSDIDDIQCITHLAERINNSLKKPFDIEGHEVSVSISTGIALYPDDGQSVETLVKHADIAMYEAKDAGRDRFHFFTKRPEKADITQAHEVLLN